MRPISLLRFNALAAYCRQPATLFAAEETGWYEHADERVLGTLIRDRTDDDYSGVIFARDGKGRFRAVHLTDFQARHRARVDLRRKMERIAAEPDETYHQGDEKGKPLDFFMSGHRMTA